MPRISYFYGISIYMYYRDHPPPHFHAIYGGEEAVVAVTDARILAGGLPVRASSMVTQWTTMHHDELQENWQLAQEGQPLNEIEPLE